MHYFRERVFNCLLIFAKNGKELATVLNFVLVLYIYLYEDSRQFF